MNTCALEKFVVESNVDQQQVTELLDSELAVVGGGTAEPSLC